MSHARLSHRVLAALGALLLAGCGDDDTAPVDTTPDPQLSGTIRTWAGTGDAAWDGDGHTLLESSFYWPCDMTITPAGDIYIVDWNNHRIRRVTAAGALETVVGTDDIGDGPPDLSDLEPPGAAGTTVDLNHPTHVLPMPDGTLIVTSWHNHKLRQYDPATGLVVVMCGRAAGFAGDGGTLEELRFDQPSQTVRDASGALFILDQRNQRVRKIAADGTISTVVGTGVSGFGGDDGPPAAAQLNMPAGGNPPTGGAVALDAQGRLYISDTLNHRIRRVDFSANVIETLAGDGTAGYGGDAGPAAAASLNNPRDIEIGPDGRLYIADELNHRVRVVDLTTGIIDTFAGNGIAGFSGEDGPPKEASLNRPEGLVFDADGNLFIVDTYNHRIRRVLL